MLDVDEPMWREQIENYGVNSVPYLVFLTAEEEVKKVLVGKPPESAIESVIISLKTHKKP
jgi:predicted DsbA family dithiol-disulfide isomerase